ncbi:MAG: serine hydroxymethyltransferase [Bacteriovoracaceae bacterium]|nr:serine hydroxymethyltransferase [Bacteriovoracaceae bacterium]
MSYEVTRDVSLTDPEIGRIIENEDMRQRLGIELIASENYCSPAVMAAQGSILTNKYAEGYPGKRYYDGCEFVDESEQIAIDRLKKIFPCEYANVQPHSGSGANMAVYFAALKPGDKFMGMDLGQGGHLTHGSPVNFSGKLFQAIHYGLDSKTEQINYDQLRDLAKKEKPKMLIAGASAYSRFIDFAAMSSIAKEVGAYLFVDMAHIAGLVAAGVHPTPVGLADFITSTTHKTLRGPRGGIILSSKEWEKSLNSQIFPGIQGGPLEHVIAAKAVAFGEALKPGFKTYQEQVVKNAKAMAKNLMEAGIEMVSGGTDNHLILLKTINLNLSGKEASTLLHHVGITCNKNMIPNDQRSPFVTSGIRLGTPAITTRGMKEGEMKFISDWIVKSLNNPTNETIQKDIAKEVKAFCREFPLFKDETTTF